MMLRDFEAYLRLAEDGTDPGANLSKALAVLFSSVDAGTVPTITQADAVRINMLLVRVSDAAARHFDGSPSNEEIELGLRSAAGIVQIAAAEIPAVNLATYADQVAILCCDIYAAGRRNALINRLRAEHPEVLTAAALAGSPAASSAVH